MDSGTGPQGRSEVSASYYDGRSSGSSAVRLSFGPDGRVALRGEDQQADYLVRAFRYAKENWSPWIGVMIVHSIADPTWTEDDEQYWWAITEPGWPEAPLRPAYEALRDMEK